MADDKIVTKKTAAKKAAATEPKTVTRKPRIQESDTLVTTSRDSPPAAPSSKTTTRTTSRKTTTAKSASAAKPATASTKTESPTRLSDHQGSLSQLATVSPETRLDMIREAAYYKAEKRHFAPGHDAEDWAAAEREIDELIARAKVMTGR